MKYLDLRTLSNDPKIIREINKISSNEHAISDYAKEIMDEYYGISLYHGTRLPNIKVLDSGLKVMSSKDLCDLVSLTWPEYSKKLIFEKLESQRLLNPYYKRTLCLEPDRLSMIHDANSFVLEGSERLRIIANSVDSNNSKRIKRSTAQMAADRRTSKFTLRRYF